MHLCSGPFILQSTPSAADALHGAAARCEIVTADIVLFRLDADRLRQNLLQILVTASAPQQRPQIKFLIRKQSRTHTPFRCDTQAVAFVAEVV